MSQPNISVQAVKSARTFSIEDLLAPDVFPHPVSALRVCETHISQVVLTGDFAYKIKKPVRFDFVDCSTLEQRRQLCEEELRLNRRLAPQLYVDVVPITCQNGAVKIGGDGPVIEYAVRMRQFPAEAELPALLASSSVAPAEIAALAELLAHFHLRAAVAGAGTDLADAQTTLDSVLGNLAHLLDQLEPSPAAQGLRMLASWCHEQAAALESSLSMRGTQGFIRECHGDLHAANIVRYGGRLVPFDCIEFSAQLRWIDVINDVAFLVMDLRSRGRDDLAVSLLSRYLEVTGDYEGVSLLRFYCVYRALVRAKIDALSMQQQPQRAAELRTRMVRRLDAATAWTTQRQPMLVLMHGASGSGKSWLSEQLVNALPAVRIRSDVERKRLAHIASTEAAPSAVYSTHFNHRTYARLADCAERCLRAGLNVIVDATSLQAADRQLFQQLARTLPASFAIVDCQADPIELASRILERGRQHTDPSDASLAVLDAQLRCMQPFTASERNHVIAVDTTQTLDVPGLARTILTQSLLPP